VKLVLHDGSLGRGRSRQRMRADEQEAAQTNRRESQDVLGGFGWHGS
jgi:hypothetical protein